jgi:hypothetical protein
MTKKQSSRQGDTSVELPLEIACAPQSVQAHYIMMVKDGSSPRFAEMCALQIAPAVKGTDRSFMQGRYNNEQLNSMPADHARNMITLAKRAGINPSGKYYAAGLADGRGPADPEAWVDSTADVVRVAKKRNLTVEGAVSHKGIPQPRPKSPILSESLTKEMMQVEKKNHPTMKQGELREMVQEKYGRKRRN